ncbi:MAG TPA: hypothetical protein VFQ44_02860 [Streptosporangiaceae bacterium]|nr:hypothetical protein [Streptosporangiaceae bacterium]
MRNTLKIPLAVGAGYLLGRKRKMGLALAVAAGAATGSVGGIAGRALKFGGKQLASSDVMSKLSPELGKVAESVKGDLAHAGKTAAKAALTNRIDALANSMHERTQALAQRVGPEGAEDEGGQRDESQEGPDDGDRPARERSGHRERPGRGERPPSREHPGRQRPASEGPARERPARERPARERPARERPVPSERRQRDSGAEEDY